MKLKNIERGMKGKAKTVFHGYKVEEFPVEILDIIKNQGPVRNLILIKAGGKKIEEIGGIAAGMSGSPVYIEGKLIGAIGYGWQLSDHRYAMVTPIEDMLKLLNISKKNSIKTNTPITLKTPMYTSGFNGRAFNRLKTEFEKKGFKVLQSGNSNVIKEEEIKAIKPGSAIAVQLVRGDISIASIGTLTYVDENQNILAFGHPFFNKGEVEYLLSQSYINSIIPSLDFPFKLGSPTNKLIGTINNDRGAGIAGQLDKFPHIIPLRIKIEDQRRGINKAVNVQLVNDEDIITSLVTNVSLQAIDSTLDRIGKGTAHTYFKITGNGLPDLSIERENYYYSRNDIAAVALYEIYHFVDMITTNPFRKIKLIDIKMDIKIDKKDNVALVQEAEVLNENIQPGDELEIDVTLHPYRAKPFVQRVKIKLPDDINPGLATLVINGGFTGENYQTIPEGDIDENEGENKAIITGYKDFESILEDYLKQPQNNDLILQVYPGYPVAQMSKPEPEIDTEDEQEKDVDKDQEKSSEEEKSTDNSTIEDNEEKEKEIKKTIRTEYVLEGSLNIDVNIVNPDTEDNNKEDKNSNEDKKEKKDP